MGQMKLAVLTGDRINEGFFFFLVLIKNDFLKHKQANIKVNSQRFGIIMTPFSRQNE